MFLLSLEDERPEDISQLKLTSLETNHTTQHRSKLQQTPQNTQTLFYPEGRYIYKFNPYAYCLGRGVVVSATAPSPCR